ncbi:hypothetical protein [Phytohabitans houttuyneae]|uniref:Uncharacterized protein n=1 Tax=Phytohabitans houttuyneae TaxID=1076126 RepID=A0A6V8K689_9ACTN|nr:hypothetical protein [Phytohabitans houttuyneae]GFJ77267.1 hypothetical protein Phou_014470 [Phytohabitans houttuyneae]
MRHGLSQTAAALAEATTAEHRPATLGINLEEPMLCATDTLIYLARFFDNLAQAADRQAQESYDPDKIGHWLRERAQQLRDTAASFHGPPLSQISR